MGHVPIRMSTLRGDQKIEFDTYVKINEKYILYLRRGDSFEGTRLSRLKEKKLKKMFIQDEDEGNYRNYLNRNISVAYDSKSGKSLETRSEIIQGQQQAVAEEIMEDPGNEYVYQEAKQAVGQFVDFLMKEDAGLSAVLNIENVDQNIVHHGVTVSSLSVGLAKKLGTVEPRQMQLMSLGALLHDFGHFHSQQAINKPLASFSPEEMELYKKHPIDGGRLAQDKEHFDQTVINIIVEHEEWIDGKGFPQGLTEAKIDPLALLVGAANALDRIITFEGVPKAQAHKHMMMNALGRYPLNYIKILGELIK